MILCFVCVSFCSYSFSWFFVLLFLLFVCFPFCLRVLSVHIVILLRLFLASFAVLGLFFSQFVCYFHIYCLFVSSACFPSPPAFNLSLPVSLYNRGQNTPWRKSVMDSDVLFLLLVYAYLFVSVRPLLPPSPPSSNLSLSFPFSPFPSVAETKHTWETWNCALINGFPVSVAICNLSLLYSNLTCHAKHTCGRGWERCVRAWLWVPLASCNTCRLPVLTATPASLSV